MSQVELVVTGMTCQHCVKTVTSALEEQPHVVGANVDLETGTASVEIDDDAESDSLTAQLIGAVKEAGYEATTA